MSLLLHAAGAGAAAAGASSAAASAAPALLSPTCAPCLLLPPPPCLPAYPTCTKCAGYSTGDPSKRMPGAAISGLTYIAFILATAAVGVRTALGA